MAESAGANYSPFGKDSVTLTDTPKNGFWGTVRICRGLKRDARRRDIPVTKEMAIVLQRLLATSKCQHVFTSPDDPTAALSKNTLGDQQRRMSKAGEFDPNTGFHSLRHTFFTEAGRHTKNVKALQILVRHANITTTMKYIHPDAEDVMMIAQAVEAARAARATEEVQGVPTKSPQCSEGI